LSPAPWVRGICVKIPVGGDKAGTAFHRRATDLGFTAVIETQRSIPMNTNAHAELANTVFQVFTIAVVGVFSVLALLTSAAQII